jgi:hypothetical protein
MARAEKTLVVAVTSFENAPSMSKSITFGQYVVYTLS